MIITKAKSYQEIKSRLKKKDKIGIVSCNMCARICGTGGIEAMQKLKRKLEKDSFQVVDLDLIGTPCNFSQLEAVTLRGDVTIVLACEAGLHNLKKAFPKKKLIPGLNLVGLGAVDKSGKLVLVKKF